MQETHSYAIGVRLPPEITQYFSGCDAGIDGILQQRVAALKAEAVFTEADQVFVKNFALPASSGGLKVSNELLERLRRSAQIWDVSLKNREISSHRPLIGPLIVAAKKAIFPILSLFFADTFRQQRDFNASVLRCLVELARSSEGDFCADDEKKG